MAHEKLTQVLTSTATKSTSKTYRPYCVPKSTPAPKTKRRNRKFERRRWSTRRQDSPRPCCRASHKSGRSLREAQQGGLRNSGFLHATWPPAQRDGHNRPQELPSIRRPTEPSRKQHTERQRLSTHKRPLQSRI